MCKILVKEWPRTAVLSRFCLSGEEVLLSEIGIGGESLSN